MPDWDRFWSDGQLYRTQEKHQYLIVDIVGGAMLNPNQTDMAMVRRTASVDGLRGVPSPIQI